MNTESTLSNYNSKSVHMLIFVDYLRQKNKVNKKLHKYYYDKTHRELNFNTYINRRRSEDKMLNLFREKFGPPEKTRIILGDYSEKQQKKFNEPSITKKTRNLFEKRKYIVNYIDEYNTSKKCHKCGSDTKNEIMLDNK